MKFAVSLTDDNGSLSECVVVTPPDQRGIFDMTICENGCFFVDSFDDVPALASSVALMDIRMSRVEEALGWVGREEGRSLQLVVPNTWDENVEQILHEPGELTIDRFTVTECATVIGVRKTIVGDRPLDDFTFGMRVNAQRAGKLGSADRLLSQSLAETAARLDNVLSLLAEYGRAIETKASNDDEPAAADAADVERLRNDLIKMRNAHDALQRKYDALASSRLGSYTLRRWEKKRKAAQRD